MKNHNALRKAAGIGTVAALGMGLLAACSSDGGDASASGSADAAGGSVYYLNFKPEVADQWTALASKYTEETGVKVTVETAAAGTYETTLKSEMGKSDAPTLFQVNGPVGLDTWKDYAADLTDSSVYSHLVDPSMALSSADGSQISGVPFAIETYGIIYNKALLADYFAADWSSIKSIDDLNTFAALKAVADEIQAHAADLGVDGAFTSAGFDSSSDWRFKTHLANIPLYYEFKEDGVTGQPETITGSYLDGYKSIFDLYITNSTVPASQLSGQTIDDSNSAFALGKAVFYQNGTWAYNDIKDQSVADEDMGMLPIYIGADGEENQGLTTGSENYWVVNSKASEADQKATQDFLDWVITSDDGRESLANEMGFTTPFDTFGDYASTNPLIIAANESLEAGKTPVAWNFTVMPSEEWKNGVGNALLAYAQGTGEWDGVVTAFVDGWASEYALSHEG